MLTVSDLIHAKEVGDFSISINQTDEGYLGVFIGEETLRAQAAIAAMQGMFATPQSNLDAMKHAYVGHECVETLFAEAAVRFADTLIAELNKTTKETK